MTGTIILYGSILLFKRSINGVNLLIVVLLIILHTGWITLLEQAILSFVPSVLPAEAGSVSRQILMINKIHTRKKYENFE